MTREQALNYMRSSGWSEEQIDTVVIALTCENAISRQAVDDAIYDYSRSCDCDYAQIMEYIDKLPSVSAEKTGRWIEQEGYYGDTYYDCSECGESFCLIDGTPTDNLYNYCPNCGCKMGVEE